jgi:hypothetical protein
MTSSLSKAIADVISNMLEVPSALALGRDMVAWRAGNL